MRRTFIALVILTALAAVAAGLFAYSGAYNIAATAPHTPPVLAVLETIQESSVRNHASEIKAPEFTKESAQAGFVAYHTMCAQCHGAPGVDRSETGQGLYPLPPDLSTGNHFTDSENFWVIKNGIKMTGMPAYGPTHSDEQLWNIVAFLRELSSMDADSYQARAEAAGIRFAVGEHAHEHENAGADLPHGHEPSTDQEINLESAQGSQGVVPPNHEQGELPAENGHSDSAHEH